MTRTELTSLLWQHRNFLWVSKLLRASRESANLGEIGFDVYVKDLKIRYEVPSTCRACRQCNVNNIRDISDFQGFRLLIVHMNDIKWLTHFSARKDVIPRYMF